MSRREQRHLRRVAQQLAQQRADREPDQDLARLRVEQSIVNDDLTWIKEQRRKRQSADADTQVERRHGTGDRRKPRWWKW
jgi:hypothetical protein